MEAQCIPKLNVEFTVRRGAGVDKVLISLSYAAH